MKDAITQLPLERPFAKQCKAWFSSIRPRTLTISVVPFVAGTLLAYSTGATINWWLLVFALASALAIQIGTNLMNDAYDSFRGADTAERLGPQRAIHKGLATPQQMYIAGMSSFIAAFLLAIPLMLHGGLIIGLAVVLSILCGFWYTGGPFPLSYSGLADFCVLLFFGCVSTLSAYWLQTEQISYAAILLSLQIGCLCTAILAVDNLRDIVADRKASKRTLAVRFGTTFARMEITLLVFLPYLGSFFWLVTGYYASALFPLLTLPLAVFLVTKVWSTEPSRSYNHFLALAALLHLTFGFAMTIGFI